MTEIEKKALALVNEVAARLGITALYEAYPHELANALCRALEQHEAFRREVSDAVESRWMNILAMKCEDVFSRFIIPKPDPLVEAMRDACGAQGLATKHTPVELTDHLRAALAARGLEIREKAGE